MIEVVKIEDFVIDQIFLPYLYDFCKSVDYFKYREMMSRQLKRCPELIIEKTERVPGLKEKVMKRIKLLGGVKWYRYLDMSNPVILWVNENLEGMESAVSEN